MDSQDRVIRKIKACLARADASSNDNAAEREIALRQANSLMDKHSITVAALGDHSSLGPHGTVEFSLQGHHVWKGSIALRIAKLYGCRVWIRGEGYHVNTFIAGRKVLREAVLSMTMYAIDAIAAEEHVVCRGKGKAFRNSFRVGAPQGIAQTVRDIIKGREGPAAPTGTALVLSGFYSQELTETNAWIADNNINLERSGKGQANNSREGQSAGIKAGAKVSLSTQIEG